MEKDRIFLDAYSCCYDPEDNPVKKKEVERELVECRVTLSDGRVKTIGFYKGA
jgi:hypothetical protein